MFNTKTIIAAAIAGILGTITNSIAINIVFDAPLMPLILSFGREAVAILVAMLMIPLFARMSSEKAYAISFIALTVIPSVLAKLVFGAGAGWGYVLFLNAIYAITAIIVYKLIVKEAHKLG